MKTIVLAMTEIEHDKRSWRCPGMVAASILLCLLLNATLREQSLLIREATGVSTSTTGENADGGEIVPLIFTAVATLGQILAAACLLVAETPRGDTPSKEALVIVAVSHAGSTFLQAYLASLGNAPAYLAVAFLEPVTALLALWVVTSVPGRVHSWLGVCSISLGVSFLTMSLTTVVASDRTSLIQGLASFSLVLKNVVIRHLIHFEKVKVTARDSSVVTGFIVLCGCVIAGVYVLASPVWIGPTFCAMTSSLLSVGLVYVTSRVLRSYNVVFASFFHVVALLVEAQVMMPWEMRPNLAVTLAAVVILCVGLFFFLKDWVESQNSSLSLMGYAKKPVNTHEQYTRIEFLLFSAMVVGVIFYVFQPRLSQRDLHTLSYVGLDKVIRRLLSVE